MWTELSEEDSCWTKTLVKVKTYTDAVAATQEHIHGAKEFVAKNIVNFIYDIDKLANTPSRLLGVGDRQTAVPKVGPGPRSQIHWLTAGGIQSQVECAEFLVRVTAVMESIVAASGLWRGEYSPTAVQLHACAAHRWFCAMIRKVGRKWKGCRIEKERVLTHVAGKARRVASPATAGLWQRVPMVTKSILKRPAGPS